MRLAVLAIGVLLIGLFIGSLLSPRSNESIRRLIVETEVANYTSTGKRCPCPYNINQVGRLCAGQSEYSHSHGTAFHCYPDEVTDSMVLEWRIRHQ